MQHRPSHRSATPISPADRRRYFSVPHLLSYLPSRIVCQRRPARQTGRVMLLLAFTGLLTSCGPHNYLNENDKLRAQNLDLQQHVSQLKQQLDLARSENTALRQKLRPHPTTMPSAVVPQLAKIQIGSYSGSLPDHRRDLRIYLRTLDGKGRFLPVAGRATLKAVFIPDKGEPQQIAEKTYPPPAFDATYRSTLMGTHYSLDLRLPKHLPNHPDHILVKVFFTQAGTGIKLTAQQSFPVPND